jgi:hypothetical protein
MDRTDSSSGDRRACQHMPEGTTTPAGLAAQATNSRLIDALSISENHEALRTQEPAMERGGRTGNRRHADWTSVFVR